MLKNGTKNTTGKSVRNCTATKDSNNPQQLKLNASIMVLPKVTLISFVLHSFLHCCVGDYLRYVCCGSLIHSIFSVKTGLILVMLFTLLSVHIC